MINPNLLSDSLANRVASEVVCARLRDAVIGHVTNEIAENVSKELLDVSLAHIAEMKRSLFFGGLFKSLVQHEKKIASTLRGIWEEQRKIVIANLKKMKKAWLQKDTVDQLLYPRKQSEAKIAKGAKKVFEGVMIERGNEELAKINAELRKPKKQTPVAEFVADFDVENPGVQKWLDGYTADLSKALEQVNTNKLRRELIEGMHKGEGIPELMKRVNLTYASWDKFRAERIARTETLMASNKGAVQAYMQSGVIKSKMWVTHFDHRTCPSCEVLDGQIIALEENFFNKGDPDEVITSGGNTFTFKNDYRDIGEPPRHALCRCSIAASFEDMTRVQRVNFHKNVTEAERKTIQGWTKSKYTLIRKYLRAGEIERENLLNRFPWLKIESETMEKLFLKYKDGATGKMLYRGIGNLPDNVYTTFQNYKTGDIAEIDKIISSWTTSEKVVNRFASATGNNIKFHLSAGRTTTLELDISKISTAALDEKEVIVNSTKFRITKITESVIPETPTSQAKKILNVYLEEVGK